MFYRATIEQLRKVHGGRTGGKRTCLGGIDVAPSVRKSIIARIRQEFAEKRVKR